MNMKFAAIAAVGALSLAGIAPKAAAADHGFYLGAGVTQSDFKLDFEGDSGSENDNGYKVIAGWRAFDWLAVEANYIDMGGVNEEGASIDSTAFTVSGLLIAEIGMVDLYARLGMINWNTDIAAESPARSVDIQTSTARAPCRPKACMGRCCRWSSRMPAIACPTAARAAPMRASRSACRAATGWRRSTPTRPRACATTSKPASTASPNASDPNLRVARRGGPQGPPRFYAHCAGFILNLHVVVRPRRE